MWYISTGTIPKKGATGTVSTILLLSRLHGDESNPIPICCVNLLFEHSGKLNTPEELDGFIQQTRQEERFVKN